MLNGSKNEEHKIMSSMGSDNVDESMRVYLVCHNGMIDVHNISSIDSS